MYLNTKMESNRERRNNGDIKQRQTTNRRKWKSDKERRIAENTRWRKICLTLTWSYVRNSSLIFSNTGTTPCESLAWPTRLVWRSTTHQTNEPTTPLTLSGEHQPLKYHMEQKTFFRRVDVYRNAQRTLMRRLCTSPKSSRKCIILVRERARLEQVSTHTLSQIRREYLKKS